MFGKKKWSATDLAEAQCRDRSIGPVVRWMVLNERPSWKQVSSHSPVTKAYWAQWNSLVLINGVLHRRCETTDSQSAVLQLVLLQALQTDVLRQLHDTVTGGHLGINKTLGKVRSRFYWVNCRRDVEEWCRSCDLCAARKGPQRKPQAPLSLYTVGAPMERVAIDILGPLPESADGNKYLLIVMDYFPKWPEGYPIPNMEAVTVANRPYGRVL